MKKSPLISTAWLAEHLDDPSLRVLDASWYLPDHNRDQSQEYLSAHIPGAQRFDIDTVAVTDSPYPHTFPSAQQFAGAVTAMGVGNENFVVAYDGLGFFSAPRVWWMFRAFGHERVAVLDGGFPKWQSESLPMEAGSKMPEPASPPFEADFKPDMVRSIDFIRGNLDSGEALVLDARAPGRYAGTAPEPRPGSRAGHIPASKNLHYARLANDQDGTFPDAEALSEIYKSASVTPDKQVVCSCGSGVTACILAMGLYIIGHEDIAIYDGSWSEWGMRTDTPIDTGSEDGQ
jgi:thiosulfate/3-mercaptopyruvate sulfurtransferase